jgi:ParB family chromosome partitioning protein
MSKSRLGRGLGALINENSEDGNSSKKIIKVYIENIEPNPFQPRKEFDEESLNELGQSIQQNGIIQPIVVRQIKPEKYQLVSGERRWRASLLVGLNNIVAIVKDYSDHQMMEIALVENIQREDLNPIEEAQAYDKMMEEFNMTQAEVAKKVGKSRSTIANVVRLLKLAPKIQVYVSRGTLSMGHARSLLPLEDKDQQIKVAEYIIDKKLSVRKTEKYVNGLKKKTKDNDIDSVNKNSKKLDKKLDQKWEKAKVVLADSFGMDVKIKKQRNKKVVTIECNDFTDMENIISTLK